MIQGTERADFAAYWQRTLRAFVGRRVRVTTLSGLLLEGELAAAGEGFELLEPTEYPTHAFPGALRARSQPERPAIPVRRPLPLAHLVAVEGLAT